MSEFDYLKDGNEVSTDDKQVLGNLKKMADYLEELARKVMETEAAYKHAQTEYDNYRHSVLPSAMLSVGVQSLSTSDGKRIEIRNKFFCNPNKNETDREKIAAWLKKWGGEHLIKRSAVVTEIDRLKDANVPYVEKWDTNTISLKAWIKDQLGLSGGVAQFSIADIPDCVHFTQLDEVEITT